LATAFFVLGDAISDAARVCIQYLRDLPLAYLIVRLTKRNFYQLIIEYDILPSLLNGEIEKEVSGEGDKYKIAMLYLLQKDYANAMETLIVAVIGY
jgi:hypothetical protein